MCLDPPLNPTGIRFYVTPLNIWIFAIFIYFIFKQYLPVFIFDDGACPFVEERKVERKENEMSICRNSNDETKEHAVPLVFK